MAAAAAAQAWTENQAAQGAGDAETGDEEGVEYGEGNFTFRRAWVGGEGSGAAEALWQKSCG